jgi:MOSC domain-containing protein YiiM
MPKTALHAVRLRTDHGIEDDAHSGPGHRQISILGHDDIENFKQAGRLDEQAGAFAENLIVAGLDLGSLGLGSRVRLGGEVILGITQIGKQCHDRHAIFRHFSCRLDVLQKKCR